MQVGKVPESVLKRSVLKTIKTKRPEVVLGASVGEDCTAVKLSEGEIMVMSTDPITGTAKDIGNLAIQITANDLASSGAEPIGVMLTVLLPDGCEESVLKEMMKQMQQHCEELNMQILGGHTEVTRVVNQPVVSVTGVGKVREGKLISTAGVKPGMDILVTKWVGLEGTSILAKEKEEELLNRFSPAFVDGAKDFDRFLSVVQEGLVAAEFGVAAMHDVTEGGIFGALWEIAEASKVGLEIELLKIPMKQETIEISEFFGINPYGLISSGSMLMAAKDGNGLVLELAKHGIAATIIGKATDGNDRVLLNNEERRFLEPPKTDELYKVL
ncbi:MAG: hydrogenase maturation factor [Lachnospiraceae bacterium]|jgi:hydrogenase maturation factor|nr:hydrogenase maturation factor [Lachnospiraceae bacterium]